MAENYLLGRNQISKSRLKLQHQVFERSSFDFIKASGIQPGMNLLEIGCGPGYMTRQLASIVGSVGSVDSYDVSLDYVLSAQGKTHELPNVSVFQSDLFNYTSTKRYDFIYCRMVLHHLQ